MRVFRVKYYILEPLKKYQGRDMLSIILMVPKRLSFMKNKIDKTLSGSNFWLFIVIFISLLPLTPLLHSGIFAGHDTPDHVARIANFYQNLSEGTLIPRW